MALQISRIYKLLLFFIFCGILLLMRLFYLQVVESNELASQSLSMRIQEIPLEVARGEIVDRNGLALTNTAQHYKIAVFPGQVQNIEIAAEQLAKLTGLSEKSFILQITANRHPFKINSKINAAMGEKINKARIPGIVVIAEKVRYGYLPLAAHITGYINLADNQGVSGIESMYDDVLRGSQPEYAVALVDAGQQIIPGLGYKRLRLSDHSGPSNIVLTIDKQIQKSVENILDKHEIKGAVVVMKPTTGEILAMASRPNFNANHLEDYLNQNSAPLLNRAISSYQPGSVFKLVTAAAALETGIVHPEDSFFDYGYIEVDHLRFNGWDYNKGGRGQLTFSDALAYSSNPVFIEVGLKLGAETLITYARKLGFGHKTNLDFTGEAEGYLPPPENLYSGELANLTIGQGTLEATPLQIVSLVSTIANDGIKVNPYVVSKLTNADGVVVKNYYASPGVRVLTQNTAKQIQDMMAAVTRYGTGQAAYVEGIGSAGKTGSAETGRTNADGQSINHAWFAGYAPVKSPQYAVVIFVEEGMSGGDIAAPIFSEIIEEITKH
jgi:cell division protein FtsI/penicillin-binding protein 2